MYKDRLLRVKPNVLWYRIGRRHNSSGYKTIKMFKGFYISWDMFNYKNNEEGD